MKTYELLAVFKPNLDAEEVDKAMVRLEEMVTGFSGKIQNVEKMGRKKLAYDIQKFRDGFFSTITLEIPADKIVEFKRQLKLSDNLLRVMFVEISKIKASK